MDGKRITPEELEAVLEGEYEALKKKICDAINAAKAGRIIAESEVPVRDAHALFRQQAYQKAIDLLACGKAKEAFSPSGQRAQLPLEE